ncbi:MAG: triose-phosphate isomerase [Planctomycetota bacterium]|jgi:triosephosphate isomerase|nr:MAG: triose-phosphate isomerase [Planctomycetota bacterium]
MDRRKIVAGNWKMNLDRAKARELAAAVAARAGEAAATELVLCPPAPYLDTVATALGSAGGSSPSGVALGAQNMHDKASGAFTGEVAAPMLLDVGCRYVILGHSERRTLFGETDKIVNAKAKAALAAGLMPIVCVGETLEEREGGRTEAVVTTQVNGSLAGLTASDLEKTVVAYEPVWAIGTGKVATPQQAQDVHALIRALLGKLASPTLAARVRIQYGGSVKPDNAADLASQPDIDGALVGGASLKADDFLGIAAAFGRHPA